VLCFVWKKVEQEWYHKVSGGSVSVVQITKVCNLNCTYCFDKIGQSQAISKHRFEMDLQTYSDYLKRINEFFYRTDVPRSICISGGEPTLHHNFLKMLSVALANGMHIYLLTNLSFDTTITKRLYSLLKEGRVKILANINDNLPLVIEKRTFKNLSFLQSKALRISFNIYDAHQSEDYLLDILRQFPQLDTTVRVGIENAVLHDLRAVGSYVFDEPLWGRYQRLGQKLDSLIGKLHAMGRSVYLDCGVGWCVLQSDTIHAIKKNGGVIHGCSVPNDEVGIDGGYSSCYALNDYGNENNTINITHHTIKRSRWHFILKTEFYKNHYLLLPQCLQCDLLALGCPRFCLSNNLYYWERFFEEHPGISQDPITNYALVEYLVSSEAFEQAHEVAHTIPLDNRVALYRILTDYLHQKSDKRVSIGALNVYMNDLSDRQITLNPKDFALAKFVDIFLKKY